MKYINSRRCIKRQKNLLYKNRILSIILISVIVLGIIPTQAYSTVNTSNIEIKDENLEKALREEIQKINPESSSEIISQDDMELLVDIDLSNRGIKSLDGIEYAVNIKSINLSDNNIEDISALGSLKSLEKYNISNQNISMSVLDADKTEVEVDNILMNIDGNSITSISGEDIDIKEEKIIFSNLTNGENIKVIHFESKDKRGEFSGKLEVNISNDIVEESTKNENAKVENEDLNSLESSKDDSDLINDNEEDTYLEHSEDKSIRNGDGKVDLEEQFYMSGINAYDDSYKILKNTLSIGNGINQTLALTSEYKLDFNRNFEVEGKVKVNKEMHSGFAISFHNNYRYNALNYNASLGVYAVPGGSYLWDRQGLADAIVLEIDSYFSTAFEDLSSDIRGQHITINETGSKGEITSYGESVHMEEELQNGIYGNIKINWDSVNNTMTMTHGESTVVKQISPNIVDSLKKTGSYITFSASTIQNRDNIEPIEFIAERVEYTDNKINYNVDYYKEENGVETLLPKEEYVEEESTIIVRHKFNNTNMISRELDTRLSLNKNSFRNSRVPIGVSGSSISKWYTPYIIKGSLKTYVESNDVDDMTISENDFLEGKDINIKIPSESKVRVIEYKIKIPKVIGNDPVSLEHTMKFGDIGMSNYEFSGLINSIGTNSILIEDINLLKGLVNNIKSTITEKRPVELDNNVYSKELQILDKIELSGLDISNISGLENCVNSIDIDLSSNNKITNVSVLSQITNLKSLNLSNNTKIKKESLSQLIELDTLIMDSADIDNEYIVEIGKLLNLRKLSLKNNHISDLSGLSSLDKLNEFYLDNNQIFDLRPIRNQIENAKLNSNKYSIKNQAVYVERPYINSGEFVFENIIYNSNDIEKNVSGSDDYENSTNRLKWFNLPIGNQEISYTWMSNQFMFDGEVNIKLNQVPGPDYLVEIPATLEMGDVLDEDSIGYDEEIDKTSINYNPDKEVIKNNPIVYGMVGVKDIISIVSEDAINGNINIYTDSSFKMNNVEDSKDTALVDVYKTFNNKLNGTAINKEDVLMSLNDINRIGVFRIKAPISRFKYNNAEYKGTMNFIIEHVK